MINKDLPSRAFPNEKASPCPKCGGERIYEKGKYIRCPPCVALVKKQYRYKNKERLRSLDKKRFDENKDNILSKMKLYYSKNKKVILAKNKEARSRRHPLYEVWHGMKDRCYNPNNSRYFRYGGRGITVCDRWKNSFENFFNDIIDGYKPGLSIERKNNDKDYYKDNCTWATPKEQANNRRSNLKYRTSIPDESPIWYQDQYMSICDFSKITKLPLIIVKYRYAYNWDAEWILAKDYENRFHEYLDYYYNVNEISLMSGLKYHVVHDRLRNLKWSVARTLLEPVRSIGKD